MQRESLNIEDIKKLSEYGLHDLPLEACVLRYESGETILQEGMTVSNLLIVRSGKAKACSTAKNGRNLVLCYYISEGMIGDIELMTNTYIAISSIIAITNFECIAIPYQSNAVKLKANIEFLNCLAKLLADKLTQSSKNYASTALYSGEERLCAYILQASLKDTFNETLTDVACSVGLSYRHMFRILDQLCKEGLLDKRNSGYRIVNRDALIQKTADLYEE